MNHKLLLQDLVDQLAEAGSIKKKEAEEFLRGFFKVSEEALFEGKTVKVPGLGSFKLIVVDARKSVNISTGEEIEIKEHYKLSFVPDATLKEQVNKPYAHLEPIELDKVILPSSEKAKVQPEPIPQEKIETPLGSEFIEPTSENSVKRSKGSIWFWVVFFTILSGLTVWSYFSNESQKEEDAQKFREMEQYDSIQALIHNDSLTQTPGDSICALAQDTGAQTTTSPSPVKMAEATPKPAATNQQQPVATKVAPLPTKATTAKAQPAPTKVAPAKVQPATTKVVTAKTTVLPEAAKALPVSLVVKSGQKLTMLALKYYGHKAFWVYIYEANKNVIKNPNILPLGATIQIPKADPTKINASDPILIDKAKALQSKLLKP